MLPSILSADFAALGGTFTVVNGVAQTDDLRMIAPLFRIEGTGRVGLPQRTVNARLEPRVVADIEGQGGAFERTGVRVPIIVEGTFDQLTFRPDVAGLVREAVEDPEALRRQVEGLTGREVQLPEELEGERGEAARQILEGLTGQPLPGGRTPDEGGEAQPQPPSPADALRSLFGR